MRVDAGKIRLRPCDLARHCGTTAGSRFLIEWGHTRRCERGKARFMLEQPLLAKKATGIAGEPAVRSDDPMTRHNNGDRIRAVRGAHRPTCSVFTEVAGELAVADCGPRWNGHKRPPNSNRAQLRVLHPLRLYRRDCPTRSRRRFPARGLLRARSQTERTRGCSKRRLYAGRRSKFALGTAAFQSTIFSPVAQVAPASISGHVCSSFFGVLRFPYPSKRGTLGRERYASRSENGQSHPG
jgi:hypothetical protein